MTVAGIVKQMSKYFLIGIWGKLRVVFGWENVVVMHTCDIRSYLAIHHNNVCFTY